MLRASYPAMLSVAEALLKNVRFKKVDSAMMPTKNVITMNVITARRAMLSVKRGKEEKKEEKPDAKKARTGDAPAEPKAAPKAAATPLAKTKVEPKAFLAYMRSLGVNFFAGVPRPRAPLPLAPGPCPCPLPLSQLRQEHLPMLRCPSPGLS